MKKSLRHALFASLFAGGLLLSYEIRAESFTGNHRLSDKEGLWFVEISSWSFSKLVERISEYDPLRATMERIKKGFLELERHQPENASLGFHWHEDDHKSMCRLYGVEWNSDRTRRMLNMDIHYATIEPKDGSCRSNGLHLRYLVSALRMTDQLQDYAIWGVMVSRGGTYWAYNPVFANIDDVPISIGMLPISQEILVSDTGVPMKLWTESIYEKTPENVWKQYGTKWEGLEAYMYTPTVEISQWQEWLKAMPAEFSEYPKIEMWKELEGYADTPPISIEKYQNWLQPRISETKTSIPVVGWKSMKPLEPAIMRGESDEPIEAGLAASISEQIYGTPSYGMLIATMCPNGFWMGTENCVLPEFEQKASKALEKSGGKFVRVPFVNR